jgi:hypothetical protein
MKTTNEFCEYNQQSSFKKIFDFKGEIAPIAEKAHRNLEVKTKNEINLLQRVHYFAIGHTFKQLDKEALFKHELDSETQKKHPTAFLSLQSFDQPFCDELKVLVGNLRNLNSHYIHSFEKIKTDQLSERMKTFVAESFELAVIQTCYNETVELTKTSLTFEAFSKQSDLDRKLVQFLCDKFYPVGNKESYPDDYLEYRTMFRTMKKQEAIDALLFAEVDTDYDWKLFGEHPVFTITAGRYLSFYGCLFMLSMFLYKSEANQLISKIKGFKRNELKEEQSKRDIFTFFAKKFSSQDIDSEENHLVKFRDLIQYLGKYPVAWNKEIELEPENPVLAIRLKMAIIDLEIDRSFPQYAGNIRFRVFAKYTIWGKRFLGKAIEKEYIQQSFTSQEMEDFSYEINTSPKLKGEHLKLADLESRTSTYTNFKQQQRNGKEIDKTKEKIKEIENEPNPVLEKLKKRIEANLLYVSYGRNQDRFMEFAARYMAEKHYFGSDAQFKLYRFYTTAEQNEAMEQLEDRLSKKEFDKLKFHHGKLTEYTTWTAHHGRYPEWDMPFVVESNAIPVKLTLGAAGEKTVSIQRDLMGYLLEHALYTDDTEGAGQRLISEYYAHHKHDFDKLKANLGTEPIAPEQKADYKKLLPRRLVNNYCPPQESTISNESPLQRVLSKALQSEERYSKLTNKAKQENRYDDFVKHNKGKQFKLQFVRKAWHLMYFRESYDQQASYSGHHKRFHITRDEFNDFSRFLFAFDEVSAYKDFLRKMLDEKGFFSNEAFKTLFEQGRSLDELYNKTKQAYQRWLESGQEREVNTEKYTLARYADLFADAMFYINLSHFTGFLRSKGLFGGKQGAMKYASLENVQYLIADFYMAERFDKAAHQNAKKLFNQLQAAKREDTLVYEMAMRYLQHEPQIVQTAKANVREIMNKTLEFNITDANGRYVYTLTVPFKQLESFETLIRHKEEQESSEFKSSFLANLAGYLEKVKIEKDVKEVYERFRNKKLSFDDLGKVNNHLISASIKFTRQALTLEHYFIFKKQQLIVHENWITIDEIPDLRAYFSKKERNKAFHFSIPDQSYRMLTEKIEKTFAANEATPQKAASFDALTKPVKYVCRQMLTANHNEFFGREKDGKKKQRDAETRYFEQVIKGNGVR